MSFEKYTKKTMEDVLKLGVLVDNEGVKTGVTVMPDGSAITMTLKKEGEEVKVAEDLFAPGSTKVTYHADSMDITISEPPVTKIESEGSLEVLEKQSFNLKAAKNAVGEDKAKFMMTRANAHKLKVRAMHHGVPDNNIHLHLDFTDDFDWAGGK